MKFTAKQAAIQVGKTPATISKAISSGKLSAEGPRGGPYSIDASDLFRLWPRVEETLTGNPRLSAADTPSETSKLQAEVEVLREKLAGTQRLCDERSEVITDLRRRLDDETEERRRVTRLLTFQPEHPQSPQSPTKGRSWWPFGRANVAT